MAKTCKEDILYRTVEGIELMATVYRPNMTGPVPFVIDVHGGAWGSGDRFNNKTIHYSFVQSGIGVFALEFRLSSEAQFPDPVRDANYGVRWFKQNLDHLNVETSLIGGLGSSSGAQQLGLVATQPTNPLYAVPDKQLTGTDATLDFFIACWPILDPLARYQMVKEKKIDRLLEAHHSYFSSPSDMMIGNPYMVVKEGRATHMPPIAIIQGEADENVDHFRADMFAEVYRKAGGHIEVHKYAAQPHTFVENAPEDPDAKDAIIKLEKFIFALNT